MYIPLCLSNEARTFSIRCITYTSFNKKVNIPSILLSKEDGDRFVTVMENNSKSIQLSITFNLLQEAARAKTVFLLQPDDFESYELLFNFEKYMKVLDQSVEFKVHYKVFRNMALDDNGLPTDEDPSMMENVMFIDDDFYFVVKNNSFEKSHLLFLESLRQMCLNFASEEIYFSYMKEVRSKCFEGPDNLGNYQPVKLFSNCTFQIYNSMIKGKDPKFDVVYLTRK